MKKKVKDLRIGDYTDLEGDEYADPDKDPGKCFAYEWEPVTEVEFETPQCVAVSFEFDTVGFPPEHILEVKDEIL